MHPFSMEGCSGPADAGRTDLFAATLGLLLLVHGQSWKMAVAGGFGGPRGRAPGLLVTRGPASFGRRTQPRSPHGQRNACPAAARRSGHAMAGLAWSGPAAGGVGMAKLNPTTRSQARSRVSATATSGPSRLAT